MTLWSPLWGLKGQPDALVELELRDASGEGPWSEKVVAPLELKTGKEHIKHSAQIMLYSLLVGDRYNTIRHLSDFDDEGDGGGRGRGGGGGRDSPLAPVSRSRRLLRAGLLVYLRDHSHHTELVSLDFQSLRELLCIRNEVAAMLRGREGPGPLPECETADILGLSRTVSLPRIKPWGESDSCFRCFQKSVCVAMHAALSVVPSCGDGDSGIGGGGAKGKGEEGGEEQSQSALALLSPSRPTYPPSSTAIPSAFNHLFGKITSPAHLFYLRRWQVRCCVASFASYRIASHPIASHLSFSVSSCTQTHTHTHIIYHISYISQHLLETEAPLWFAHRARSRAWVLPGGGTLFEVRDGWIPLRL